MAKPTTLSWSKMSIWVGDGASPVEDFERQSCGLTSHTFGLRGTATEVDVPDCDNPDDPVWIERTIRNLSSDVAGAGVMATETFEAWRTWMLSGLFRNVRIVIDLPALPGYYFGRYVMTVLEHVGTNEDGKIRNNLSMLSDGEVDWAAGAP
jgi:hypothetical protein